MTSRTGQVDSGGTPCTRAMLRRMKRTRLVLVPLEPAARTPAYVITAWCEEYELGVSADAIAELSSSLHRGGVFYVADDGALIGSIIGETLTAIGDALATQADLIDEAQWPERNRLRLFAERYRRELAHALGELGMT